MPEIKKVFMQGKMNQDLDERIVPQGEYREAQNIQIARGVDTSSQLGVESTDISASTGAGGGTKKKVDVEVTVNGQPV